MAIGIGVKAAFDIHIARHERRHLLSATALTGLRAAHIILLLAPLSAQALELIL